MNTYSDTSFVVSLYMPDVNSIRAAKIAGLIDIRLHLSPLGLIETRNAMYLRMFRRQDTAEQIEIALKEFQADVSSGFFKVVGFPDEIWRVAAELAAAHTTTFGTRTLDILHVAAAIVARSVAFATFDHNQSRLARAASLRIATDLAA